MDNSEIIKQVLDFLERTGTALLQTGFNASVQYVVANAIGDLIASGISLIIFILCLWYFMKGMRRIDRDEKEKTKETESWEFSTKLIISAVLGLGFFISFMTYSPFHAIKVLISPEWYAILEIINLVK